ncbi:MAG: pectate lyase [Balneolaceae bacterium]
MNLSETSWLSFLPTIVSNILFIPLFLIMFFISCGESGQSGDQIAVDPLDWDEALEQDAKWHQSSEAVRIADNVLLYQYESGGWPKNIDMAQVLSEADKDSIRNEQTAGGTLSNTTIDNGATYTQMRFLARTYNATGDERYREGFLRGIDYLLDAQYDNGGWPQYYPIREGYYERITFNDNAMIGVMRLLRNVAERNTLYDFLDDERLVKVNAALDKGLDVILKTQIEVNGNLTAWCAQHDENDFSPAGARSYEHPSISGSESVGIVRYLMEIEDPGPDVIRAVEQAVDWFDRVQIANIRVVETEIDGKRDYIVEQDPAYDSIWARFYEIGTNRPIFSGRDGVIKYEMSEIERERRVGYRWYGTWPRELLEKEYPEWRAKHNLSMQ